MTSKSAVKVPPAAKPVIDIQVSLEQIALAVVAITQFVVNTALASMVDS